MHKKTFSEYTNEELLFELSLYDKIEIDYEKYEESYDLYHTDEYNNPYDYHQNKNYLVVSNTYSKDFSRLINFLKSDDKFYKFCLQCNKENHNLYDMAFRTSAIDLDDELSNHILYSWCDEKCDIEDYNLNVKTHVVSNWCDEKYNIKDYDPYANFNGMKNRIIKLLEKNDGYFYKEIICSLDPTHVYKFYFKLEFEFGFEFEFDWLDGLKLYITKIGQYPSIENFDKNKIKIKKYKKELGELGTEFSKAISLHASGIGIGSFVYLRRIIEKLILDAENKAVADGTLTLEEVDKLEIKETKLKNANKKLVALAKEHLVPNSILTKEELEELESLFDEKNKIKRFKNNTVTNKIKILKNYLPRFLVDNALSYGIISKGLHELSEDKCKEMFPILKNTIEIILDERIAEKEKAIKEKETKAKLNEIHTDLKTKK